MAQISSNKTMDCFTVRDLRKRAGELIHEAEAGKLSVVTKHGNPVFVAVPFDEALVKGGVRVLLAAKLFDDGALTLAQAAKFADLALEEMIERLGAAGIDVVRQPLEELDQEFEVIARHGRR